MASPKKEIAKAEALQAVIKQKLAARITRDMDEHKQKVDKSAQMFKNTRVTSCNQVLMKNGQAVCMAFKVGAPKPVDLNAKKLQEVSSLSAEQFKVRDNLHAGMIKKPLAPYHPNAFRSRLP